MTLKQLRNEGDALPKIWAQLQNRTSALRYIYCHTYIYINVYVFLSIHKVVSGITSLISCRFYSGCAEIMIQLLFLYCRHCLGFCHSLYVHVLKRILNSIQVSKAGLFERHLEV